jgi:hypothetical protein
MGEKMTKSNFDDIDQIPVVHVNVKRVDGEIDSIQYESNDQNLLNEIVDQIDFNRIN